MRSPPRVAGLEVMSMTPAVANLIRNNEIARIQDVIQTSRDRGMFSLDSHLQQLVKEGQVESRCRARLQPGSSDPSQAAGPPARLTASDRQSHPGQRSVV